MTHRAIVAFGANLGDPLATFQEVSDILQGIPGIDGLVRSPLYETRPAGGPVDQPTFRNAAFALTTDLEPSELQVVLQSIETDFGKRVGGARWGPRPIDLDLVLFGDAVIETPSLVVPHPRMHTRWFVLRPVCDVASDAVHPLLRVSVGELFERVARPDPAILVHTDKQDTFDQCRGRIVKSRPHAQVLHCPSMEPPVHFLQLGAAAVGIVLNEAQTKQLGCDPTWVILNRSLGSDALEGGLAGVPVNVFDARSETDNGFLELAGCFLDSLEPASRVLISE